MPPKNQLTPLGGPQPPPLLPALFLLAAPITWPILEYYTIQGFAHGQPTYSPTIESLTDLGIDYRQVHELKHHNVQSLRHEFINADFLLAAACFGVAQTLMLWFARHRGRIAIMRGLLTGVYVAGMVLFARIHGGPREKIWKIVGWHWNGLVMAAIGGNLNSVLAAAVPGQIHPFEEGVVYRGLSLVLGSAGLYSFYRWAFTLGEWNYITQLGLWERGCVYPVLLWMGVTGVFLLVAKFGGNGGAAKGKKA